MSSPSGGTSGGSSNTTIWDLTPAQLSVLQSDVEGYLGGLQVLHYTVVAMTALLVWDVIGTWDKEAHYVWRTRWSWAKFVFLFNRYLGPSTFIIQCVSLFWTPRNAAQCMSFGWSVIALLALTGSTASSILATRLWALYERDRRMLAALILGFLACFAPGYILVFTAGATSFDPDQLRVFENVLLYIEGVEIQEGPGGLYWKLEKCFRFNFTKRSYSILIGSLLYESGIFTALMWKMLRDPKGTQILEAFYRDGIIYYFVIFSSYAIALSTGFDFSNPVAQSFVTSGFYIGTKSLMCSHIILRLRSYFAKGDPIVDGHTASGIFDGVPGGGGDKETDSGGSLVSTIIHFAQMVSGGVTSTFDVRSKGTVVREDPPTRFNVSAATPGERERERRGSVDWFTDATPNAGSRRTSAILGEPPRNAAGRRWMGGGGGGRAWREEEPPPLAILEMHDITPQRLEGGPPRNSRSIEIDLVALREVHHRHPPALGDRGSD